MLRAILIVFIGIALSACRSGDDVSSTGGVRLTSNKATSASSAPAKQHNTTREATKLPAPAPAPAPVEQQATTSSPVYTSQPVTAPEAADPISHQPVTLEWTIPMHRENGDQLSASELNGYIIEFVNQSDPGAVDQAYVEGGQISTHLLSLPPGSYRFRVIAVDNNGLTSNPSDWVNADLV